jgi:hypothetical protein
MLSEQILIYMLQQMLLEFLEPMLLEQLLLEHMFLEQIFYRMDPWF